MNVKKQSAKLQARIDKIASERREIWEEMRKYDHGSPEWTACYARENALIKTEHELKNRLMSALAREAGGVENLTIEVVMEFSYDARKKWRLREMHAADIKTVGDALRAKAQTGTYLSYHLSKLAEILYRYRYVIEPTRTGRRIVRKPKWYFEQE